MTELRYCSAPGCPRIVSGLHDICARHMAMLPVGQSRLIRRMRIECTHAGTPEARQYLSEQLDGYVRAAVRQLPGSAGMSKVSLAGQIAEVNREIALRRNTYPRLVAAGKMRQGEADMCIQRIEAVLATLYFVQEHEAGFRAYVAEKKATQA